MRWLLLCSLLLAAPAYSAPRQMMGKKSLRNPIVLVHGATTKGSQLQIGLFNFGDYFRNIPHFYAPSGTPVGLAHLSTDGSIGERAAVLKNFLETEFRGQQVNIVAHSLGGLDARYAASVLGARQIASITTIGTPHLGSPLANWAARQSENGSPWYWFFRLLGYDLRQRRFLKEITTDFMATTFNPRVQNLASVKYFSVVTSANFRDSSMSYWFYFPVRWLEGEKHPLSANGHDGLVPRDSQVWGKVLVTQTLDHLGQINHHELRTAEIGAESTALNIYTAVYDNLSQEGL
jgi:triacylglycerol lipase